MEPEHGKKSKTNQKIDNSSPRKSSGADASIADEKSYPDEIRSEEKCFDVLNKNTHIAWPSVKEASSRTVNKVKEKKGETRTRNDQW